MAHTVPDARTIQAAGRLSGPRYPRKRGLKHVWPRRTRNAGHGTTLVMRATDADQSRRALPEETPACTPSRPPADVR